MVWVYNIVTQPISETLFPSSSYLPYFSLSCIFTLVTLERELLILREELNDELLSSFPCYPFYLLTRLIVISHFNSCHGAGERERAVVRDIKIKF